MFDNNVLMWVLRIDHLCIDQAALMNPLTLSTYDDEDFVGKCKKLAMRSDVRALGYQTLHRYAAYVCCRWLRQLTDSWVMVNGFWCNLFLFKSLYWCSMFGWNDHQVPSAGESPALIEACFFTEKGRRDFRQAEWGRMVPTRSQNLWFVGLFRVYDLGYQTMFGKGCPITAPCISKNSETKKRPLEGAGICIYIYILR